MKKITTDILNEIYLSEEEVNIKKLDRDVDNKIVINKENTISTFLGMGGAITEASAYNYSLLSSLKREELINAYYSPEGLNYGMGRISIASNDFSLEPFEYLRSDDLTGFDISQDQKYVIPMLQDIYAVKKIKLIASPWSPPSFMKSNRNLLEGGKLRKKYYNLYADYLAKYIHTYSSMGFNIKYLTMQNEPFAKQRWESCWYSFNDQKNFIYNHLINKIKNLDTSVLLWDHNREDLPLVVDKLYINNSLIAGIGMHWYTGGYFANIKCVHDKYPNLTLINTEMCCGYSPYNQKDWLNDAELYIKDIVPAFNSGLNAYLDWNILLDYYGGPSHKENYVKSAIILNEEKSNFIKTPIYYYLYHIAHFTHDGYKIIESDSYTNDLYVLAVNSKKNMIVVICNPNDKAYEYNLIINEKYISNKINDHSIITYII